MYKHSNLHKKHLRYYKQLMKQDKLICAVCNKLLPNESVLKKHLRIHVQGERAKQKVPCDTCGKFIGRFCMKVRERSLFKAIFRFQRSEILPPFDGSTAKTYPLCALKFGPPKTYQIAPLNLLPLKFPYSPTAAWAAYSIVVIKQNSW